ncbi:hypothetical protein AAU57_11965 [Nonlabens sp. YIK11]|uniref:hypothetical protein n=1 Tax=Nonlabens sp. YIK11 TaxID=1453349 RepID=UPI0006DD269D|nr:hypothetical protein [Nonlabens sp. YIK11]KQC33964.1 hypothetical protein AAU57_11965 [Nonlabens sp. YIK11]
MATQDNIIDNCDDLMLPAFAKVVNTGDLKVLGNGTDEQLGAAWDKIMDEYRSIVGKGSDTVVWRKKVQLQAVINQYNDVTKALNIYFNSDLEDDQKSELLKLLKKDKINIDPKADVKQEIERINRQLKAKETNINFRTSELKAILPEPTEKKEFDLTAQLYQLGRVLEYNYKLIAKETSLKEFALMIKEAEQRNSKNKAA